MNRTVPTPDKPRPVPGRIGSVLKLLHVLIGHARYLAATVATRVDVPEFATAAAVFGTYQLPVILLRVRRALLRALALQQYLLDRAAQGRELRFDWRPSVELQPHHRPPPGPPRAPRTGPAPNRQPDPATLGQDDPASFRMPTQAELAAWARSRPVGRSIAFICMDLGLIPGFCDGALWNQVYNVLRRYNGSIHRMYEVRERREKEFQRERDARPETWHIDWRDLDPHTVRKALGCKIGEPPPPGAWATAPS